MKLTQRAKSWLVAALLCLHPLLSPSVQAAPLGDGEEVDHIVAVVDDDVVVRSELDAEIRIIAAKIRDSGAAMPPQAVLERQVLERLITTKLQLAAAQKAGIDISDEILAKAIGSIARNNGMTLSEMRDALEADGIPFASFRDKLRRELTISRLQNQQVINRIQVTTAEVDAFLARNMGSGASQRSEYHIRHILLSTPDGASPETIDRARDKAEKLAAELRAGEDFAAAASRVSDGRQALSGGDLGWLDAAQVPSLFAPVVVTMERGDVSEPLRSASGFHIIKLEDYKGGERSVISQTHARHILIRTSEIVSDDDARVRLEQLRSRILGGDDFANLARSHSNDKGSAIKGGDLGWVSPGDLVPRFEEEMNALAPNEISQPFRTQFGWHIVQVLDRRDYDNTEEVRRNEARRAIQERKADEAIELFIRRLRDEAYIELHLDQDI